jgi:hypothetical protein
MPPLFAGASDVAQGIARLRARVAERSAASVVKMERAFVDYEDRLTKAEAKLAGELDRHALEAEGAMQELTNAGEQVFNDSSTGSSVEGSPFRRAAE